MGVCRLKPARFAVPGSIVSCLLGAFGADLAHARAEPEVRPEFRAYWADSLYHPGLKSRDQIDLLLATLRAGHMNAVVAQMRRRGDTYYKSTLEPMAPDADPSFDALEYLCRQAHAPGRPRIDVHAWICTFPVWRTPRQKWGPPKSPDHVLNRHPEWLDKFSDGRTDVGPNYCLDPGHPQAMQFTVDVAMDVVRRYDIDGVNFDYIRYPEDDVQGRIEWGYNEVSVARFNTLHHKTGTPSNSDPDWRQFRRDQVTAFLRKVYAGVLSVKPGVKVSADTWTTLSGPPLPAPTTEEGWREATPYAVIWQDWRAWMEEGILDINMPMTYFRGASDAFDKWTAYEKSHKYGRHLSIGIRGYDQTRDDIFHQLDGTRTAAAWGGRTYRADGQQLYFYHQPYQGGIDAAPAFAAELAARFYPTAVPVPDMPWKSRPATGHIKGTAIAAGKAGIDGMTVTLSGPESRSMRTDGTGFYAFIDLAPGRYTVSCSHAGQSRASRAEVTAGCVTDADFNFSP